MSSVIRWPVPVSSLVCTSSTPLRSCLWSEVVVAAKSAPDTVQRGAALVLQINKLPLVVKSAPGFVVNRVLAPYLVEALNALDQKLDATHIDAAATAFGMPVGPIELADQIGLDVCLHVTATLGKPDELERVRLRLQPYIDKGHLGKKTGRRLLHLESRQAAKGESHEPGRRQDATSQNDSSIRYWMNASACWQRNWSTARTDLMRALSLAPASRRSAVVHCTTENRPGNRPAGRLMGRRKSITRATHEHARIAPGGDHRWRHERPFAVLTPCMKI